MRYANMHQRFCRAPNIWQRNAILETLAKRVYCYNVPPSTDLLEVSLKKHTYKDPKSCRPNQERNVLSREKTCFQFSMILSNI